jgi:hypothetical protein
MGPLIGGHRTVGSPCCHASVEADFDPEATFAPPSDCKRGALQLIGARFAVWFTPP